MKKFECHDCIGHCKVTIYRDYITPCSCMHNKKPVDWHEVKETVTDYSQWPKLTVEVFNRPECPVWANYAAVNKSGRGFYFRSEPEKTEHVWKLPPDHKMVNIGEFDPSDWENSLIKRPPKEDLPDWCKGGKWGYNTETHDYFEIVSIDNVFVNIYIHGYGPCQQSYGIIREHCIEARKRSFNEKEMRALVGKLFTNSEGDASIATAFDRYLNSIYIYFDSYDSDELAKSDWRLDDKPCYKLEHKNDKGEWV